MDISTNPITHNVHEFHQALLRWFEKVQRSYLPWRLTADPYAILVAEKLLQQTSARQLVVDAFNEIMRHYPTPLELSKADSNELRKLIHSLGFTYRADELRRMASELVEFHGGKIPDNIAELLDLTGIGQYCARAVLSFAFHKDIAIVDTNVARFLYRLYGLLGIPPSSPASNKKLIALAETLIPHGQSREYNLAILDLCAFICTKRNPKCLECPVLKYCAYGQSQIEISSI